ncbi:hypothetical protein BD560DRAFT_405652 [Blakeslea trispora]|nr:hypothetical protein BD560DRAFT_405652 [Blakeslea trispora]
MPASNSLDFLPVFLAFLNQSTILFGHLLWYIKKNDKIRQGTNNNQVKSLASFLRRPVERRTTPT